MRHSRTDSTDYVLQAALFSFRSMPEQTEADLSSPDLFELAGRDDVPTDSTALPPGSEATQDTGTPNSAPERNHVDDNCENKTIELRSDLLHTTSSPASLKSYPPTGDHLVAVRGPDVGISSDQISEMQTCGSMVRARMYVSCA